ncbi:MAG: hypothetical protein Q9225_001372 [Loekoesia sp. 1 TL-2023]
MKGSRKGQKIEAAVDSDDPVHLRPRFLSEPPDSATPIASALENLDFSSQYRRGPSGHPPTVLHEVLANNLKRKGSPNQRSLTYAFQSSTIITTDTPEQQESMLFKSGRGEERASYGTSHRWGGESGTETPTALTAEKSGRRSKYKKEAHKSHFISVYDPRPCGKRNIWAGNGGLYGGRSDSKSRLNMTRNIEGGSITVHKQRNQEQTKRSDILCPSSSATTRTQTSP